LNTEHGVEDIESLPCKSQYAAPSFRKPANARVFTVIGGIVTSSLTRLSEYLPSVQTLEVHLKTSTYDLEQARLLHCAKSFSPRRFLSEPPFAMPRDGRRIPIATSLGLTERLYSMSKTLDSKMFSSRVRHILKKGSRNRIVYEARASNDPGAYYGLELEVVESGHYDYDTAVARAEWEMKTPTRNGRAVGDARNAVSTGRSTAGSDVEACRQALRDDRESGHGRHRGRSLGCSSNQ